MSPLRVRVNPESEVPTNWFERWLDSVDWRRVDRSLLKTSQVLMFAAGTVLAYGVLFAAVHFGLRAVGR